MQLKLNADVNWTIKLSKNQIKEGGKQNSIRRCQQCNKPGTIGEKKAWFAQIYKLKTNYVKNATNDSSAEQLTASHFH